MTELSMEQIRAFRLRAHHLAGNRGRTAQVLAGACGLQNTPPGAWETAFYSRAPGCSPAEPERLLYEEKLLLQAWSLRGAPMVFPTEESAVFLSALQAKGEEQWIYTRGIGLALDFLQLPLAQLLRLLKQVLPRLDGQTIASKSALDQTLAEWMLPLLPPQKRRLWNQPSMYGSPDKQTVGGAAVSFLLRPCAFGGLVVFGRREGAGPTFTSYKNWIGHPLQSDEEAEKKLVRKYLHCYGPATKDTFISWLGCGPKQGRRLWTGLSQEMEPVMVQGKKAYILAADRKELFSAAAFPRELLLLGGHDPFLDQRDRVVLQPDKTLHRQIWKTVANPGVIVYRGEAVGIWTVQKKSGGIEFHMTLWKEQRQSPRLCRLAEEYAAFRRQRLAGVALE